MREFGNKKICVTAVVLAFVAVVTGYTLCYALCPFNMDDVWYRLIYRDWLRGDSDSFPGADFFENFRIYYWGINVRLANLALSLTCWMPQCIQAVAAGLILAGTIVMMLRLCEANQRPVVAISVIAGYVFLLPWHEYMFCFAFMWNYSAATLLILCVLRSFFKKWRGIIAGRKLVLPLMTALVCGGWHEGFSVPLFAGLGVWILLNRRSATRERIIIWLSLLPGILFISLSDAFASRASRFYWDFTFGGDLLGFLLGRPLFCLYLAVLAATCVVGGLRKRAGIGLHSIHPVIFTMCLMTLVMQAHFDMALRIGWISGTMSLIGLALIAVRLLPPRFVSGKSFAGTGVVMALCLLLLAHVAVTDQFAFRIHALNMDILKKYDLSADGTVFADYVRDIDYPLLSLKRPYVDFFEIEVHDSKQRPFKLLPVQFRDVPYSRNKWKIPGNNPAYEIDGYYYFPADSLGRSVPYFGIWLFNFNGNCRPARVRYIPFVGRDGETYVSATPGRIVRDLRFRKLESVDF